MQKQNQPEQVRALFQGCSFGSPCTEAQILRAETELGRSLPEVLRELYLAFDGFYGPTNAGFFWPLLGDYGLVRRNKFFCDQLYDGVPLFPQSLVMHSIFFGDDGGSVEWGIKQDLPDRVVEWSGGDSFEIVDGYPLDVWRKAKGRYDAL